MSDQGTFIDKDSVSAFLRAALAGVLIILLGVAAWRLATIRLEVLQFRFSDLLSLLLALFAVGLSAAFYFRTTETSNRFYDNSFRFTKEISETLGRIEERFGERLKHIDESYSGLYSKLTAAESRAEGTAAEVESEKQELERLASERKEIISELLERARVSESERDGIVEKLSTTESELDRAREQLAFLQAEHKHAQEQLNALRHEAAREDFKGERDTHPFFSWFEDMWVPDAIDKKGLKKAPQGVLLRELDKEFRKEEGPPRRDAQRFGYFDEEAGWLPPGASAIKRITRAM